MLKNRLLALFFQKKVFIFEQLVFGNNTVNAVLKFIA